MIIKVIVDFDSDEKPLTQYIDTKKLDCNNYIDSEFLKAVKNKQYECYVETLYCYTYPKRLLCVNKLSAEIEKSDKVDKTMRLTIGN